MIGVFYNSILKSIYPLVVSTCKAIRIETESPGGSGKLSITGIGTDRQTKESIHTAFNYFKANRKSIRANINVDSSDFMIHVEDLQGAGPSSEIALASFVSLVSSSLKKRSKKVW